MSVTDTRSVFRFVETDLSFALRLGLQTHLPTLVPSHSLISRNLSPYLMMRMDWSLRQVVLVHQWRGVCEVLRSSFTRQTATDTKTMKLIDGPKIGQ